MRNRMGQALVEFALISFLFLLLCFVLLQLGYVLGTYLTLQHAVQDGARAAAVRACPSAQDARDIATITRNAASRFVAPSSIVPVIRYSQTSAKYSDVVTVTVTYRIAPIDPLTRSVLPGQDTIFTSSKLMTTGCQFASRPVVIGTMPTPIPIAPTQPATNPTATRAPVTGSPTATRRPTAVPPTATRAPVTGSPTATRRPTAVPPTATRAPVTGSPTATRRPTVVPPTATRAPVTGSPTATRAPTTVPTSAPTPLPIAQSLVAYKATQAGSSVLQPLLLQGRVYELGTGRGIGGVTMIIHVDSMYAPARTLSLVTDASGYATVCNAASYRYDDQISIGVDPMANGTGAGAAGLPNVTVQTSGTQRICP